LIEKVCRAAARSVRPIGCMDRSDYFQEAYLKIHDMDGSEAYLFTAARNRLLDCIRKERLRLCTEYKDGLTLSSSTTLSVCLTGLEARLVEYKLDGLTYTDIASLEQVTRWRVSRWYADLREKITSRPTMAAATEISL